MTAQALIIAVLGGGLIAGLGQLVTALVGWRKSKSESIDSSFDRAERVLGMMDRVLEEQRTEIFRLKDQMSQRDEKIKELEIEVARLRTLLEERG